MAGSNPRPVSNGLFPAIAPNGDQSPAQVSINQDGQLTPQVNQFVPPPQAGQQPFNGVPPFGGSPIGFNPQQAAPFQRPNVVGAQPNPPALGAPSGNAALDAINNQLFRPNQAPATGPTGSPGIAGVASKFKGPSIKAYRERTKYQEWEFVYEPITNQPGQPGVAGQGQNGLGQNGMGPNGGPPGLGQTPAGGQPNPFSQPNPFAPQTPTR